MPTGHAYTCICLHCTCMLLLKNVDPFIIQSGMLLWEKNCNVVETHATHLLWQLQENRLQLGMFQERFALCFLGEVHVALQSHRIKEIRRRC